MSSIVDWISFLKLVTVIRAELLAKRFIDLRMLYKLHLDLLLGAKFHLESCANHQPTYLMRWRTNMKEYLSFFVQETRASIEVLLAERSTNE